MSDHIELLSDGIVVQGPEVIIQEAKPSGWLCFYRLNKESNWMYVSPSYTSGVTYDYYRYPMPLFQSKDEAIDEVRKFLPNGGQVKFFKVEF